MPAPALSLALAALCAGCPVPPSLVAKLTAGPRSHSHSMYIHASSDLRWKPLFQTFGDDGDHKNEDNEPEDHPSMTAEEATEEEGESIP